MIDLNFSAIVWFILLAFAAFRVSWLMTREEGPFRLFGKVRERLNIKAFHEQPGTGGPKWTLAELMNCPLCLGIWLSAILLILVLFPGIVLKLVILWLAIAGLQSFLTLLIIKDE